MYFYSALSESICCLPIEDHQNWPHRNFGCPSASFFHYPPALASFFLIYPSISLSTVCSHSSHIPLTLLFLQAADTDFSNVGTMIECGLFTEALDSIRCAVYPGLLPPAPYLVTLLDYAQQVGPQLPHGENSTCCDTDFLNFGTFLTFSMIIRLNSLIHTTAPTSVFVCWMCHRERPHLCSSEISFRFCITYLLPTLPGTLRAQWRSILRQCCSVRSVRRACGLS